MLEEHWAYASDLIRTERYREALTRGGPQMGDVLDLGCGVGILGLLALQAGAQRIIGVERTGLSGTALETLSRFASPDRVEIFRGECAEVTLPAPVDLIVCDHVGYLGIDYQITALLKDARRRFLKPGGRIIPQALRLYLGLVEAEACRHKALRWTDESVPEALHWLSHYDVNAKHPVRLAGSDLLAAPAVLDDIDLMSEERDFFSWRARFQVTRGGELHGLAGWFDCRLAEGVQMTNSPLADDRINRPQAFLPISDPLEVAEGETVDASVAMRPSEQLIAWTVTHPASGRTFRQSTWEASLLGAEAVRRARPDHVPQPSGRGKARQIVLGYCDGRRTVREIEVAVLRDHPDLMPSQQAVSDFVAEVLGRDTTRGYRLGPPREQASLVERPYHQWTLPGDEPWLAFHRVPDGFLLRFPGLADFHVTEDGREAICVPVPGTPEDTCKHLYLNQVLPLMLGRQGKLVFHASAVALDRGAVAFLGESGRGKSTLAAAFATFGARFLSDDGMVLEEDGAWQVVPSHPSIRLREDSRQALIGADLEYVPGVCYAAKMRMPAQARLPHCEQALPLRAAFFLGLGEVDAVSLEQLNGQEALVEWVRHAFVLDVDDRAGLAAHFAGVGQLVEAVPCWRLDYPRRFEALDRVRHAISEHATGRGARP